MKGRCGILQQSQNGQGLEKDLILVCSHIKCLWHLRQQFLIAFCSTRRLLFAKKFEFRGNDMGSEVKFHRGDHSDHSSEMFST